MNDFDEIPENPPQLALMGLGVDGATFHLTACIARATPYTGPLRLSAPLLPSVENIGTSGRIA